jgi:hypothetical protein
MMRLLRFLVFLAMLVLGPAWLAKAVLQSRGDEESDEVDLVTILAGRSLLSRSQDFLGGNCLTVLGGLDLDLRTAGLGPTGADLDLVTIVGGARVLVPTGWRVSLEPRVIMGGASGPTGPVDADAPHLRVRALTVLGGIEIAARPRLEAVPA